MDAYWNNGIATLYHTDAQQIPLPDKSVHCVVTSPPYWGLRSYGHWEMQTLWGEWTHFPASRRYMDERHRLMLKWRAAERGGIFCRHGCCWIGGLGLEPTFGLYVEHLVRVFREVMRVLRDDGTLWLNLGDSYNQGSNSARNPGQSRADGGNIGYRNGVVGLNRPNVTGLKPKDLIGQPWQIAFALQNDGVAHWRDVRTMEHVMDAMHDAYIDEPMPEPVRDTLARLYAEYAVAKGHSWYLRSAIVWHKPNPMPESTTDRPTSAYEMVFLLAKHVRYFYDADAIRIPAAEGGRIKAVPANAKTQVYTDASKAGLVNHERINPIAANARNVWTIPTQGRTDAHFATFPDELPRRCIQAGTSEHGVCDVCGAQWARVVKIEGRRGVAYHSHRNDLIDGQSKAANAPHITRETIGWEPVCECDAERVPATVLDPFAGSGTTCAVAQSVGRHSVGLDLNMEYLQIAMRRLEGVTLPLLL